MVKRRSTDDYGENDNSIPLPIQTFLWRQTSPFIRPKINRLQDAAAMEQREACKSFEKVLVQNIQFGLSPSLTEAIRSISRWRLIQSALPHVMHCCAALLYGRRNSSFDKLSATETKLLYTLHWILLDASEECADAEAEEGLIRSPEHYLLQITTIQLFIYLFAPLIPHLRESDFLSSFRLENGYKIWTSLFNHAHPDIPSFTSQVKPKRNILRATRHEKKSTAKFGDVFLGVSSLEKDDSTQPREITPTPSVVSSDTSQPPVTPTPTPTPTPFISPFISSPTVASMTGSISSEKRGSNESSSPIKIDHSKPPHAVKTNVLPDPSMATYLDVAVLRCLFTSQWLEEGIDWALQYINNRLKTVGKDWSKSQIQRPRSKSLPAPKCEPFLVIAPESKRKSAPPKSIFDIDGDNLITMSSSPFLPASRHASMTDLRRSSFSGLPGLGSLGLAGLGALIGTGTGLVTGMDRHGSERIKSPKRFKKGSGSASSGSTASGVANDTTQKNGRKRTEKILEKVMTDTQMTNKYKEQKEKDKNDTIFRSGELIPPPPRPKSALGQCDYGKAKMPEKAIKGKTEMQRGRSMPSLHLLLDKFSGHSNADKTGTSLTIPNENDYYLKDSSLPPPSPLRRVVSHSIPNPIITITEHSPVASVQFFLNQESDSPNDSPALQFPGIIRSQTDANISYFSDTIAEASASTHYVTKNGQLSLIIILKAVHSLTLHESICTLRICENILEVINKLISLDILPKFIPPIDIEISAHQNGSTTPASISCQTPGTGTGPVSGPEPASKRKLSPDNDELSIHHLMIDTVLRLVKHLGCPHGCGEGHRESTVGQLRKDINVTLLCLYNSNEDQFWHFLHEMVTRRSIQEIIDIFHAFLGFCNDSPSGLGSNLMCAPNSQNRRIHNPSVTIQGQQSIDSLPRTGYATNFGAGFTKVGPKGAEGILINAVFKSFVIRMTKIQKDLKLQENMSLYCEVRQFIAYVRDNHGGIFRKVALSGLIESVQILNRAKDGKISLSALRRERQISDADETRSGQYSPTNFNDDDDRNRNRKSFFRKKHSSSGIKQAQSNQSIHDDVIDWPLPGTGLNSSQSSSALRVHRSVSPRLSITDDDAELIVQKSQSSKSVKDSKGFLVSWFKTKDQSSALHPDSATLFMDNGASSMQSDLTESDRLVRRSSFSRLPVKNQSTSSVIGTGAKTSGHGTFSKARKRVEDQFKFVFGKSKSKHGSFEDTVDLSRRNSYDFERIGSDGDLFMREAKLVPLPVVRDGMLRFQFLLESCAPGSLPDAPLIAAMLDLRAPVVARAAFFLECANFVHRCNRGLWPSWMRLNFSILRPSGPLKNGSSSARGRASNALQRHAGRVFYQWAESLGSRIDELLQNEINTERSLTNMTDDGKRRHLRAEDEDEDFLDESVVNPTGSECPFALKMVACQLLMEITAFLRETHQYFPTRTSRSSVRGDRGLSFEPRTFTANRRWSMALSSLGFSQASAHSLMSLAGVGVGQDGQPMHSGGHLSERRISFVLHEADGEGDSRSSSVSMNLHDENNTQVNDDSKRKRMSQTGQNPIRTNLLRRSTGGSGHGSFKRRSFKLKRPPQGNDRNKHLSSALIEDDDDDGQSIKRADSVRSQRRKVSGISEKSDTSERVSGDESPIVMSDDGQAPDSPSDTLEADDSEITTNIPWFKLLTTIGSSMTFQCEHHQYCQTNCYQRSMRSCSRLIRAVKKVYTYDSTAPQLEMIAFRLFDDRDDALKKEKKLKKIVTGPSSPKRKASLGHNIDKYDSHGHSIHSSTTYLAHVGTNFDVEAGITETEDPRRTFAEVANYKAMIKKEENLTLKYINLQVKNPFHSFISMQIKGALILSQSLFEELLTLSWNLLLEHDQQLASTSAVAIIVCALKIPESVSDLLSKELNHEDPQRRSSAINKFYVIWRSRYQCWPRLEEGAHLYIKVPPPAIEFTLPSPRIALEAIPVVDPPYMPVVKAKVEEVTISQEPAFQKSFVAATKTRRKQQIELVTKALQMEEDKLKEERENYRISAVPVTLQAAYEPALFHTIEEHEEGDDDSMERPLAHHIQVAQSLFPSSLCTASVTIINLLNDSHVTSDGSTVYEVAYKVIWHCLVEDSALFLRHFLEKLTREKQSVIFQILRRLIRFMPRLPAQAAYTLYNYLIGFVMFYVRSPVEGSQELIASVLSVLWLVVPSVYGLFLKDLKQVLRKEQCDSTLLITANVPSAKKIIVHGPDASAIPSQFPIHEDTQFIQLLTDSLDFFGIDDAQSNEHFLVDTKTNQMHNLSSFVRDFYFFKRSQYPQISLVHMNPTEAFETLQREAFTLKFVELGKVLMSLSVVKSSSYALQRVLFLHEELMKLPSFPRKALESNFGLYDGPMGREVLGMDTLHKIAWVKLMSRMFEATSGFFAQSSDIHLFLNVVNGAMILHCEDASLLRLCCATFINAAHQFKNIFAVNGYLLIMPTIFRIYSNHQTNGLLCRTIEFVCKQFYILHRKPFILQMFGSIAPILDMDLISNFGDASKVQPRAFFQLLQSMSQYIVDPLDILELVDAEKPLKALDFCYQMDPETLTILDAISLCVTVVAYSSDSQRGHQMLSILEAILPLHLKHMQTSTTKKETGGPRTELQMIHNISVCIKTLIINSEPLTRNFTGPQRAIDLRGSSMKTTSKGGISPLYEIDEDSHSKLMTDSYYPQQRVTSRPSQYTESNDGELMRNEFRRPRDSLLNVVAEFLTRSTARLKDLSKKLPDLHQKGSSYELFDVKCHMRLAEIAHSLLKMAPYDPPTMACRGLVRYMNEILPNSEWRQETMRPALIMVLRRLDKTFAKIAKKSAIKRSTDWDAAKRLLKGVYLTFVKHPYIVHLPHLKSLISVCQNIVLGEHGHGPSESSSTLPSWAVALSQTSPPGFSSVAVRLIALQMLQLGETQTLETLCSGAFSSPEKSEIYLMNMIYPMCLRISGGLKEVPKLRQCDINFTLTVILNTLIPVSSKSGTGKGSDSSAMVNNPMQSALNQVGFLGLKIMIVCFERQLTTEWHRISKSVRDFANKSHGGVTLWNFFDFVVTFRTPLFLLLFPVIRYKYLQKICDNDQEYFYQQQIREKIHGRGMPSNRSKGQLLIQLNNEMRILKEDLINRKSRADDRNRSIIPDMSSGGGIEKSQRLSFAFTSMAPSISKSSNVSSPASNTQQGAHPGTGEGQSEYNEDVKVVTPSKSLLRGWSFRSGSGGASPESGANRFPPRGLSVKLPSGRETGRKLAERFLRRTSYPYPQNETSNGKEKLKEEQTLSEPKLYRKSTLHIKKRGSKRSAGSGSIPGSGGTSVEALHESDAIDEDERERQTADRKYSIDTIGDGSGSASPDGDDKKLKHRLQRQKAQSRKTFRFHKSRKGKSYGVIEHDKEIEQKNTEEIQLLNTSELTKPSSSESHTNIMHKDSLSVIISPANGEDKSLEFQEFKDHDKDQDKEWSGDECSALLIKNECVKSDSQSALIMFPYVDDDVDDNSCV